MVRVVMLALSLVLLPATDAGAALRSAGSGTGLVSDGRRWAFWSEGPGVRVFDDVRGAVRAMRGLGPCASRWGVAAVKPAHGLALVTCPTETAEYPYEELYDNRVFVPADRRARRLPGAQPTDYLVRIGRRWAEGYSPGEESRETLSVLANWRTGERIETTEECWNLDARRPKPLRDGSCFDGESLQHDDSFRLRWIGDPQVTGDQIDLFRGSRQVVRLNRKSCGDRVESFCSMQLGGGWVTMARPREVLAYQIATRRTRRWRAAVTRVVHTRRHLFARRGSVILHAPL